MKKKIAELMAAMVEYDRGDPKRIQHFVKVHDLAATIGVLEGLNDEKSFVLEAAAILHDVGIHLCESKYGSCLGKQQELEGPAEARKVMATVGGFTASQEERICFLIAHHHTYNQVDGMDYQILLEADYLVNAYEDSFSAGTVRHASEAIFKTESGKKLLAGMFL